MTSNEFPPIQLTSRIRRSTRQVHCQVGDQIVLMAVSGGEYFELNRVGSRLWEEVASPISIAELVDRMLLEFDVDRATCESQVLAWAAKMRRLEFIEVGEPSPGS